jgi:hypothetical protein
VNRFDFTLRSLRVIVWFVAIIILFLEIQAVSQDSFVFSLAYPIFDESEVSPNAPPP